MAVDEQLWSECQRVTARPPPRVPALLGVVDGNRVLVVDFNLLKVLPETPRHDREWMDTVEGANDLEDNEIAKRFGRKVLLLDSNLHPRCWPFVCYHEAFERRQMAKGLSYDRAHTLANHGERQLRLRAQTARPTALSQAQERGTGS